MTGGGEERDDGAPARPIRRRALFAAPLVLAAPPGFAAPAGLLDAARRAGRLRVALTPTLRSLPRPPAPPKAPARDLLSEALAPRLAGLMNLRAEIEQTRLPGEAIEWLAQGLVDVALPIALTRPAAREVMFARPHLVTDLVVLAPRGERQRRRLAEWMGVPLAGRARLLEALADLGQPTELISLRPAETPEALEEALLRGEAYGALTTAVEARALQDRNPSRGWIIRTVLATQPYAAATAFGEHDLRRALDQAVMLALEEGVVAGLFREAYGLPFPPLPEEH